MCLKVPRLSQIPASHSVFHSESTRNSLCALFAFEHAHWSSWRCSASEEGVRTLVNYLVRWAILIRLHSFQSIHFIHYPIPLISLCVCLFAWTTLKIGMYIWDGRKGISVLQLKLYRNCISDARTLSWLGTDVTSFNFFKTPLLTMGYCPKCSKCQSQLTYQGFSRQQPQRPKWSFWYSNWNIGKTYKLSNKQLVEPCTIQIQTLLHCILLWSDTQIETAWVLN